MVQRWAYLGPVGTFTQQAVGELSGRTAVQVEPVPCSGVSAALAEVRSGRADAAVVPLENSVEGSVPLTHDELIHGDPLVIAGEAFVPVTFDLLVRPGTELHQIAEVGSHPHGLAQVRDWVAAHLPGAGTVVTSSTAQAAAEVAAGRLSAAAAAPVAGSEYGLFAAATDIGLERDAVTRFVLLRPPGPPAPATGNDRSSLLLSVDNRPGALLDALTEITGRGINMVRLESRPTRNRINEYLFLVDVDGHLSHPAIRQMVAALARRGALLRWLGSYPRASGANAAVPDFASADAYTRAESTVATLLGETE